MCRCLKRGVQQLAWRVGAATPMLQVRRRDSTRRKGACDERGPTPVGGARGGSDSEGPSRATRVGVAKALCDGTVFQFLHGTGWACSGASADGGVSLSGHDNTTANGHDRGCQGWRGDGVTGGVIRPTWLAVSVAVGLVETGPMPEAGRGGVLDHGEGGGSRILRLHGAGGAWGWKAARRKL
ncbi:hypothetical protein PSV08DRAFT_251192 [Bipolaris maydis]|uniref:uncharacterized protein n=1 Tax=Cochliobolus heterostrophus TaxID=5016 RepID=UPI0024D4AD31|nr:hypothetical protein J3E73DRAFT_260334 [Bipolaris maydis]KAJ6267136.1 hypothetical protein PSV08DRAFT_251192 [Bipolaris maydis]KAJ6277756.1 hypothetical protein J3E71DRAFT_244811 [Bipolaris maydis]